MREASLVIEIVFSADASLSALRERVLEVAAGHPDGRPGVKTAIEEAFRDGDVVYAVMTCGAWRVDLGGGWAVGIRSGVREGFRGRSCRP
ncbi:hypothetical protein ABZ845_30880 [Streptomyces sp. NPDC047022]|uniref:hypothetical protein n=1 Tax=Streptomyces sp. NPDC047022 TaxID=3155737 RepID=UPI0033E469F5